MDDKDSILVITSVLKSYTSNETAEMEHATRRRLLSSSLNYILSACL